jgi:tripartite-type tricarboxylate transporter receptor subunit TctC
MGRPIAKIGESIMRHLIRICSIVCALLGLATLAQAQSSYPDRPVRFMIAFPPGGATDTFFRPLVDALGAALGQTVVIENRGGGGGYIAWQAVANSPPDGYTFLVAENAVPISRALYKQHPSGFDPVKHYDAVAAIGVSPLVLCVHPSVPAKSFAELVAYSKTLPQKMNYAHAGAGTVSHLVFEVVAEAAGMNVQAVPYKGGGPAMNDVVAGHVSAIVAGTSVGKAHNDSGKLRCLAVTSEKRTPALVNIPTLKELGVKHADVDLSFWWGIFSPKGTPDAIKAKVEKAFQTTMADAKVQERLLRVGTDPTFASGKVLQAKLENEIKNWSTFIDAKGIRPN